MEREINIQNMETTSNFLTQMLINETEGSEFVQAYLKAGFLSSAVDALFHARRQADLTQSQIAELMKTKQSAIARMEADTSGTMSLYRYVEFALACGMVPLDIKLVPVKALQSYAIAHPDVPRTQELYNTWLLNSGQVALAPGNKVEVNVTTIAPSSNTCERYQDAQQAVAYVENFLRQAPQQVCEVKTHSINSEYQNRLQSSSSLGHIWSQKEVAA